MQNLKIGLLIICKLNSKRLNKKNFKRSKWKIDFRDFNNSTLKQI